METGTPQGSALRISPVVRGLTYAGLRHISPVYVGGLRLQNGTHSVSTLWYLDTEMDSEAGYPSDSVCACQPKMENPRVEPPS